MSNPLIYQLPTPSVSSVGISPNFKFMVSGDDLTSLTTPGYLNQIDLQSNPISTTDILQVLYNFNNHSQSGDYGAFAVSINDGIITLSAANIPGEIVLPVTPGNFANWANTSGALKDDLYSPTQTTLTKIVMLEPNNLGATPLVSNVPVFLNSAGSIAPQQAGQPSYFQGPVYVSRGTNANHFGISFSDGTPTAFGSSIQGLNSIDQDTIYSMVDPLSASATIAIFPQNPVTIPSGNLLTSGSIPGTIADGGAIGDSVVSTVGTSTMQTGSKIVFDHVLPQTIGGGDTVTINNQSGIIQTNTLTLASGAEYTFTLNNTLLTSDGNILLQLQYGDNLTRNIELALLAPPNNGNCQITIINNNTAAMNGNMKVYFLVVY